MKNILLVGNGNVASYLRKALKTNGVSISDSSNNKDCDAVIFSITDDAYVDAIASFPVDGKLMIHTSGSVPSTVFSGKTNHFGVIYPYQTISKQDENINYRNIPLLVTASDKETQEMLIDLAKKLSDIVRVISDEQRLKLHLAAVFANNFTNHMITIAQKIAEENNLDATLLEPLLEKTFWQLKNKPAAELQTGPAVRNDIKIIEKHLNLLENHPEWQKVYSFASESIRKEHRTKKSE